MIVMATFCKRIFVLLIGIMSGMTVLAQSQEVLDAYQEKVHEVDGVQLQYRMLLPPNFDENKKYPLLLFLHGAGERGSDNTKQLVHGASLFLDSQNTYPSIVVFPQCPQEDYWANVDRVETPQGLHFTFYDDRPANPSLTAVIDLVDVLLQKDYVDKDRFYCTGLSMGGMGVFELLKRIPDKIAAAAPICGGGAMSSAHRMTSVPIWAFHGVQDNVVQPRHSIAMIYGVQQAGGQAKITLYPHANHNSWDATFSDPEYLEWLYSHKRNN